MANNVWLGTTSTAFGTGTNWSAGSAPTTGDNIIFDGRATQGLVGSDQSAITLASIRVYRSYAYDVGSTTTPLKIGATTVDLYLEPDGQTSGTGPSLIALDYYTIQNTTTVYNNARTVGSSGFPCVMLKGTHASNVLSVKGGTVGVGLFAPNEATTWSKIHVDGDAAYLVIGGGTTLTTLNQKRGKIKLYCAATTINQDGGELETIGSGAITTANISGKLISNSTGTITTLYVNSAGVADFSTSAISRTVTNCTIYGASSKIEADNNSALSITFSNGVICSQGAKSNQVNMGDGVTVSFT